MQLIFLQVAWNQSTCFFACIIVYPYNYGKTSEFETCVICTKVLNSKESHMYSAPGHDELTLGIIQLCFPTIKEPLVHILNLSLTEELFPDELE